MDSNSNEWAVWSKYVLAEIERLSDSQEKMSSDQADGREKSEENQKEMLSLISQINVTLASQAGVLADHTRRSLAAEAGLELIRADVKVLQKHSSLIEGAIKLLVGMGGAFGAFAAIKELFFK